MYRVKGNINRGTCVKCESYNINYDTFEIEDGYGGYFPTICNDCGQEGKEYYNIVYEFSTARIKIK
jgi:RNase P subunit RPR2